jgi:hypothetical protein
MDIIYINIYINIYMHAYVYVYIDIYAYICTHTHTHTNVPHACFACTCMHAPVCPCVKHRHECLFDCARNEYRAMRMTGMQK